MEDPRIKEIGFGEYEGVSCNGEDPVSRAFRLFFNAPGEYIAPKGAETIEELYERTGDFTFLESEDYTEVTAGYFDLDSGELTLGDIVISVDKVREQAKEYGHSEQRELAFLVAHSMFHLFGYDHMEEEERKEMEKMQREVLDKLGIVR